MNIVKWTPFRELEDMQTRSNRFFGDAPMRALEGDGLFFADWAPVVDIEETDREYLIKAELPDVAKENVKVQMIDSVLTIEGERKREKEEAAKIQAEFRAALLNVPLPKTTAAKPKAIEVKVA